MHEWATTRKVRYSLLKGDLPEATLDRGRSLMRTIALLRAGGSDRDQHSVGLQPGPVGRPLSAAVRLQSAR